MWSNDERIIELGYQINHVLNMVILTEKKKNWLSSN